MPSRLLLTVPILFVFGLAAAQPRSDYSKDTIRVTAQWSHDAPAPTSSRKMAGVRASVISASPLAQVAFLPASLQQQVNKATAPVEAAPATDQVAADASDNSFVQNLLNYARKQLATRYRSGGTSPGGFDCSGFVRYCFTKFGIALPHSSSAQAGLGARIDREFAQPGDLIFFNGHAAGGSQVGHVGIITEVINDRIKFIHSANGGGVKFDLLNADYYRKRFVTIRRVARMMADN